MAFETGVRVGIDAEPAQRGAQEFGRATGQVAREARAMESGVATAARGVKLAIAGIATSAAALTTLRLTQWIVSTAASFEQLRLQLARTEGSTAAAERTFDALKRFADVTPFQIDGVTRSWILLRDRGFQPTLELMGSLGNVAAAFSKDVFDATLAVSQALVGETEMLKQFGITARIEGDKMTLIFKGQRYELDRTAEAFAAWVNKMGQGEFAGATEAMGRSLTGALSTMSDAFDGFADKVGRAGVGEAVERLARKVTDLTDESGGLADELGVRLAGAIDKVTEALDWLGQEDNLDDVVDGLKAMAAVAIAVGIGNTAAAVGTLAGRLMLLAADPRVLAVLGALAAVGGAAAIVHGLASMFADKGVSSPEEWNATHGSGAPTKPVAPLVLKDWTAPMRAGGGPVTLEDILTNRSTLPAADTSGMNMGVGTGDKAEKAAERAAKRRAEAIADMAAQYDAAIRLAEAEARGALAAERMQVVLEAENQARQAGIALGSTEHQQMVERALAIHEMTTARERQLAVEDAYANEVAAQAAERMDPTKNVAARGESALQAMRDSVLEFEQVAVGAFQGVSDSLVDLAMDGKASWSDMVESMIRDLMRLAVQQALMGIVMGAFQMAGGTPGYVSGGGYTDPDVLSGAAPNPTWGRSPGGSSLIGQAPPQQVAYQAPGAQVKVQVVNERGVSTEVGQQTEDPATGESMLRMVSRRVRDDLFDDGARGGALHRWMGQYGGRRSSMYG